jgi:hypothetical protein
LDNQASEEGIPIELSYGATGMDFGLDSGLDLGLEEATIVLNISLTLEQGISMRLGASVDVQDDIFLAHLAKAVFSLGKG